VTSTQAVPWHLLRMAGVKTPISGFAACCTSISSFLGSEPAQKSMIRRIKRNFDANKDLWLTVCC
jgi:hypothetical protein